MNIAMMDMGEILTMSGKNFFARRDDSPGNFFVKYGEIWTRFMNDSDVADWWYEKYGSILRTDEHSRLITMPDPGQLFETLMFIKELQNRQADSYDAYWTDARKIQHELEDKTIPQKPARIDIDFERAMSALRGQESAWTGVSFTKLFRGFREQKTYRVSTYLIGMTLWAIWNPQEDKTITQADALEAIRKRREQNRINMQKVRDMQKAASGFGEHSKNLTHVMQEYTKRESSIAKMTQEIESLKNKLQRFNDQQQHAFDVLTQYLNNPTTHSESQHDKLKELLKDDESPW